MSDGNQSQSQNQGEPTPSISMGDSNAAHSRKTAHHKYPMAQNAVGHHSQQKRGEDNSPKTKTVSTDLSWEIDLNGLCMRKTCTQQQNTRERHTRFLREDSSLRVRGNSLTSARKSTGHPEDEQTSTGGETDQP